MDRRDEVKSRCQNFAELQNSASWPAAVGRSRHWSMSSRHRHGTRGCGRLWIKDLTRNVGADAVLECVGTNESMYQAIDAAHPGGSIGFVGVPHGVVLTGEFLFFSQKTLLGGPAPVRSCRTLSTSS